MIQIGILGGGAAGFFGAIEAARLTGGRARVIILEKGQDPLTKVKISGGGRCNVTHHLFDPEELCQKYPRGSKELRFAFERFQPRDTIEWFSKRGVELKAESDGRMFPITNKSATIIECFKREAEKAGVEILLNTPIRSIRVEEENAGGKFILEKEDSESIQFDKLLIATGSNRTVWNWMEVLGHTIETPVPSLFTLNIPDPRIKDLPGISVQEAEITVLPKGKPQMGPILITHWGLSGPAVLRLSAREARRFAECGYRTKVKVNWAGKTNSEEFLSELKTIKQESPSKRIASTGWSIFPSRLWETFMQSAGIDFEKRWSEISNAELHKLRDEVCNCIFEVEGKGVFKDEFVTCGGIKRKEVDFKTMESRIIPGLYFAGEVLDIDGITGGFNFQNAWTTSFIAAEAIAGSI